MRIMAEFHGNATSLFTSIPGFGMERMLPMYERIPWEVPHFSTNDVEVEKAPAIPKLLKDVFAKSLDSFEKSTPAAGTTASPAVAAKGQPGFGRALHGTIVSGMQLRLLDLIGNLDPARPKVYSGGKAFEVIRSKRVGPTTVIPFEALQLEVAKKADKEAKDTKSHVGAMEQRPLDMFENAGLAELSDGKETFIREKGNVIRMMGALRARDQCLNCHTDNRKGDLLGALSYTFLDASNAAKNGAGKQQP
jgi:hypothetical protein